jgi:hypothetical protein
MERPCPDSRNYAGVTFTGCRKMMMMMIIINWIASVQLRNKPVTTQIRNRSDSNFTTMSVSYVTVCS